MRNRRKLRMALRSSRVHKTNRPRNKGIVPNPLESPKNLQGPDGDEDKCTECGAPTDDGEGYDGKCGNCADVAERNGAFTS